MAEALLPSGFLMVKKKKGGDRVMRKATNAMGIKQTQHETGDRSPTTGLEGWPNVGVRLDWQSIEVRFEVCNLQFLESRGFMMSKRGHRGSAGNKFRMSLGLPVAATVNCADNTGVKNLYIYIISTWTHD
nr:60S ribosomal protein L23-like [Ipomoea batatas]